MTERPLLSVIVPSFNQGRFLRETLESALAQDYRPIEVLVFDGASTDESVDVLRSFDGVPEIRWVSEPDRGVVDAVNKGLAAASGEILALQSSDDVYLPGAFSAAVGALQARPDVALVYGDVEYIDETGHLTGATALPPFSLAEFLVKFSYVPQPAAFFRRDAARETGVWDDTVSYAADSDYWLRIVLTHPALKLDRRIARYRYHAAQRDKAGARVARDWERAVRRHLESGRITPALRRDALCGIHLTRHHYTPEGAWVRRTQHLWGAALAHPRRIAHPAFPKRELLPGREPLWKLLSKMKRTARSLFRGSRAASS